MNHSFNGLEIIIQELFEEPATSGAFFVFLNRQKDRMKVLYWDGDGFAIWYKHLQRGSFTTAISHGHATERREFLMMLEGIEPKKMRKHFKP
jgi:transposase